MWPPQGQTRPWLINVMWALSAFSDENGATRLWPGSHRATLDRDLDEAASVAAEMAKGSACVFLGALTHGAGANISKAPRTGIIISYCLGWLRTYENQYLAYPRETAQGFHPDLQRLIGYQMHRPNLGGWEGQNPIAYLAPVSCGPAPHCDALTPAIAEEIASYYKGARESRA
jgi:ectoine hydroxylase-related dioxygenase (phytanoyl-CoA dioxygenase family)